MKKSKTQVNDVLVKVINHETKSQEQQFEYFKKLKALEFNGINSLDSSKKALSIINGLIKGRLKHANLNNRQKAEIELIGKLECF